MDDPRDVFLRKVRSHMGFQVDQSFIPHIRESLLDALFYTIADYVHHERITDELGVGKLERLHSFPREFLECDDPHEWLDVHRKTDDGSLIMYIHDNISQMNRGKHRQIMLYLFNILHFDL